MNKKLSHKLSLFILVNIIFTMIYFIFCNNETDWHFINDCDKDNLNKKDGLFLLDYLYFTFTTFTTVGFGDITPRSRKCRLLVILQLLTIITLVMI